jgi:hypothetical protein
MSDDLVMAWTLSGQMPRMPNNKTIPPQDGRTTGSALVPISGLHATWIID